MRYRVSAFPRYEDGSTGDLCSFEQGEQLPDVMLRTADGVEKWLEADREDGEDIMPVGFEFSVDL